jgi:hypothetical protein
MEVKAEDGALVERDQDDSKTPGSGKGRNSRGGKGKKPFKKKMRDVVFERSYVIQQSNHPA